MLEHAGHRGPRSDAMDMDERAARVASPAGARLDGVAGSPRQHLGQGVEGVARARRVVRVERDDLIERVEGDEGHGRAQVTPVEFHSCSAPSKRGHRAHGA